MSKKEVLVPLTRKALNITQQSGEPCFKETIGSLGREFLS